MIVVADASVASTRCTTHSCCPRQSRSSSRPIQRTGARLAAKGPSFTWAISHDDLLDSPHRPIPTLNWIGKEAVIRHHQAVPFRLLEPCPRRQPGGQRNLIVQDDNLHALKALLPRYAGQVKCIYIDPPYNTGNEGWAYNDNINSAEIRRCLGCSSKRPMRWRCRLRPRNCEGKPKCKSSNCSTKR